MSEMSKSPCSSHRAANTFEALGTSLIVVLGFLVSTETMEKSNFAVESLFWYFYLILFFNHYSFYREGEFADEADF